MDKIQTEIIDQAQRGIDASRIEYIFRQGKREYINQSLQINYEPPFTEWLLEYTFATLSRDFVVESQKENLRDVGEQMYPEEINEYALSKADLVIRRENSKEDIMSCCMVSLVKDDICSIDKVQGMVAELKLHDGSNKPIWECFRNMSAVGASLAMEELAGGTLVDNVIVYGVVGRVDSLQHSRLIKLDMDFINGESKFMKCRKEFDFDILMNIIVDCL